MFSDGFGAHRAGAVLVQAARKERVEGEAVLEAGWRTRWVLKIIVRHLTIEYMLLFFQSSKCWRSARSPWSGAPGQSSSRESSISDDLRANKFCNGHTYCLIECHPSQLQTPLMHIFFKFARHNHCDVSCQVFYGVELTIGELVFVTRTGMSTPSDVQH